MVYQYDESIVNDLRTITKMSDKTIYIIPPSEYFDLVSMMNSDNIKLPLISLSRPGWSLQDKKPQAMIFEGKNILDDTENDLVRNLQAIPIEIDYQLDVWTNNRLENDMIMRELIWNYTLNPTLEVKIPYKDSNYRHTFNIFFNSDVEDNSDIQEHKNLGRLFRQTITFYTNDAYLWKINDRRHTKFSIELGVKNSFEKEELIYDNSEEHK